MPCEHSDHPSFLFPVHVDHIGSVEECDEDEIHRLSFGDTHALIYTDGCIAVTLYECCYGLWDARSGVAMRLHALWGKDYRLSASALPLIAEHVAKLKETE